MIGTAAVSAAATVLLGLTPVSVGLSSPVGHVVIETAAAVVSLLVAFIVLGRFLQTGRLSELVLASALTLLGVSNLVFSAGPAAAGHPFSAWATWAAGTGRLLSAAGFAVAAFMGDARTRRPREATLKAAAAAAAILVLTALVFAVIAGHVPVALDPALSPDAPGRPRFVGNAAVLAMQAVGMAFYAIAAVGFYQRATRDRDRLMGWVAVASVLQTFAAFNYVLFASLYSQWLYTGDWLRIGFYAVLLGGAAGEIQRYQLGLEQAAALEERRRLARELHDGLAQELAFIATQTRWLSKRETGNGLGQLVVAAERALDESRSAISALTRPLDEPLDAALAQAAEEVAGRVGVRLRLDLAEGVEVPVATREALVRIVREAVSNTARHGKASCVTLGLSAGDGVSVRITDDGVGFDPESGDGPGFGLTSMRERAHALGAQFQVSSTPGEGTEIQVVLR